MEDVATILGCKNEPIPFNYLGIKVGSRYKKASDWKYVVDKVRNRLNKWSRSKISIGGRITLIKSVLSAMPTYALSLFRAPLCVLNSLISLQQRFLWGGGRGERKIIWAKWDRLTLPKEAGGFGFRDLDSFNKALLAKWMWRALEGGGGGVWIDFVKGSIRSGRGGGLSGADLMSEQKVRGWWGQVVGVLRDGGGEWFVNSMERRVGNGESTSFWDDVWVGDRALRACFPQLFGLCTSKDSSVAGGGGWCGDEWRWKMGWLRDFRVRDSNDINLLIDLLACRKDSSNEADGWWWKHEVGGKYTVKSGYNIMEMRKRVRDPGVKAICKLIWGIFTPPKVKVNSWRILFERIATKTELSKRGVSLPNAAVDCPLCEEVQEDIDHIFIGCDKVNLLWRNILKWLGVQAIMSNRVIENFIQFCYLANGKKKRLFLASLWACTTWCIWRKRNEIVFNSGKWNHEKAMGDIKSHLWSWAKGWKTEEEVKLSFGLWWEDQLLLCL